MAFETSDLVKKFRRAGPPALLAACLAIGPALAQSVTVETPGPTTQQTETKTTVKEKWNGDTVVKEKTKTTNSDDATISTEKRIEEPSTTTTTTTVR